MSDSADQRWVIAPGVNASWDGGSLALQSPCTAAWRILQHADTLVLLHSFAQPRTIAEVSAEHVHLAPAVLRQFVGQLAEEGFLIRASDTEAPPHSPWDAVSLAFHRATRGPQPTGGSALALPVLRRIPLRPSAPPVLDGLRDLLDRRHSTRQWDSQAIPLQSLALLLNLGCGTRYRNGQPHRAYPSGGGLYTLEVYLAAAADAVAELEGGLYRYDPQGRALDCICEIADAVLPLRVAAGRSMGAAAPPLCLIVTSRIAEQQKVYGELAYSLVLKETGALVQTLYLLAAQLDLAACALGRGTEDALFARLSGTDGLRQPIVAEFALGSAVRG